MGGEGETPSPPYFYRRRKVMKKHFFVFGLILVLITCFVSVSKAGWDNATWIQKGQRITTGQVSVSSSTVATILSAKANRVDFIIKNNNTAYDLFIGSFSTVSTTTGYPISPKSTISSDGLFTGVIYGIYDAASGTTNVPTLEAFTP